MRRLTLSVFAITALSSCATTTAPSPASSAGRPAALAPPLDSLAFYVGHWQCKGTRFSENGQPKERWQATIDVEPELDGKWLSVRMTGPDENRTAEHKGYDPSSKRWIHVAVANDGSWITMSSPGWSGSGSQMVFTPDDHTDRSHATFTKLSETAYSHAVSLDTDHGPEKVWEKQCTKP